MWAGAALGGSLRRASSKDGQRVRRRSRSRSPLARGSAPRPGAVTGGKCGANLPPKASRREASRTQRGRARPRRLLSPPAAEEQTMAARAPGWAERGAARGALPTPVRRPASEGRGHRARGAQRPGVESPRPAPPRGALLAGTRAPGPGAGRAETPAAPRGRGRTGEGAVAAPLSFISCLQQKGTRFSFSEISFCLTVFRSFFSASRTDLNWGRTEMAKVRLRVG